MSPDRSSSPEPDSLGSWTGRGTARARPYDPDGVALLIERIISTDSSSGYRALLNVTGPEAARRHRVLPLGGFEHLVEMPLQEFPVGSVTRPLGDSNWLTGPGVELPAVVELLMQPRADQQSMPRIDA